MDSTTLCLAQAWVCNDFDPCTSDSCNPAQGCIFATKPDCAGCIFDQDCNDGDACSVDACEEYGQCSNEDFGDLGLAVPGFCQ